MKNFKNFNIPEEIREELQEAVKTVTAFGEERSFLPLAVKKIWFRTKFPNGAIRYAVLDKGDDFITVESRVFTDCTLPNEAFIGSGIVSVNLEEARTLATSFMTEADLKRTMEPLARGKAATRALQDAGFGLQFYDRNNEIDTETELLEKQAETEAEIKTEFQPVQANNTPVEMPKDEKKPEPKPVNEPVSKPPVKQPEPKPVTTTSATPMTIEEARSIVADCGKAAEMGLTLGQCEEKQPLNLKWMYKQPNCSEKNKAAIRVIATNNPQVATYLEGLIL